MLEVFTGAVFGAVVGFGLILGMMFYDLIWLEEPQGPDAYHAVSTLLTLIAAGALVGLASCWTHYI